jgi:hypothetical protein
MITASPPTLTLESLMGFAVMVKVFAAPSPLNACELSAAAVPSIYKSPSLLDLASTVPRM